MREDRDFDNIIEGMGGTPAPMIPPPPPPSTGDRIKDTLKLLGLSFVAFVLQVAGVGWSVMYINQIVVNEFALTTPGMSYGSSVAIAIFLILGGSLLRKATA